MKALVFHHPKKVSVDQVPDPRIERPTDAIVRVTSTAICGSDLHIFNGFFPQTRPMTLGHEFVGVVEEVGKGVTKLKKGDRVVVPFPIGCGACFFCNHEMPGHCENSNPKHYGAEGGLLTQKGGGLFGYTDLYGGYDGGQAEAVRVPSANVGPRKVPENLSDEQVLFLSDIFPTGYSGIDWAGVKGGEVVAVFGCGPVGLMAMKSAWLRGASRVIGIDIEAYRADAARHTTGSEVINAREQDPVELIRQMTGGRGADVCVDAVGLESHRSPLKRVRNLVHGEMGSIATLKTCLSAVRRGGFVSVLGVYGISYDAFPVGQFFDKGIRMAAGQAPVQKHIGHLMDLVASEKVKLNDIITHRLPLSEAAHGYEIFCEKKEGCVKVVLKP
jgi:threonine dehydrogenase-like Zn-dependent dehydrogenase